MNATSMNNIIKTVKEVLSLYDIFSICDRIDYDIERLPLEILACKSDFFPLLAGYSLCPSDILTRVWKERDKVSECRQEEFLMHMAQNPNAKSEIFSDLLAYEDYRLDKEMAKNRDISRQILRELTSKKRSEMQGDCRAGIIAEVIKNPNCDKALMKELLKELSQTTKLELINNKWCKDALLEQLILDEDVNVACTASRRKIGGIEKLAERLTESNGAVTGDEQCILALVTKDSDILKKLSHSDNLDIVCNVIRNIECPSSVLRRISKSDNNAVKECIAARKGTSIAVLSKLADDGCETVREKVANNESTPANLLDQLSYDSDSNVKFAVIQNPHTYDSTRFRMFEEDSDRDVRYMAANCIHDVGRFNFKETFSKTICYKSLLGFLENSWVDEQELRNVYEIVRERKIYSDWMMIGAICSNEGITEETIEYLFENSIPIDDYETRRALRNLLMNEDFRLHLDEVIKAVFGF